MISDSIKAKAEHAEPAENPKIMEFEPEQMPAHRVVRPGPEFRRAYSDNAFKFKLARYARKAGRELLCKALELYYAAKAPETPTWAKSTIYGALGYFISTVDLIPDFIPAVGLTDDLTVLAAALSTVAAHVTPEMKARAEEVSSRWFT